MDRFLYMCDSHLNHKNKASRVDNYHNSIMKKIEFCYKYCKDNNITSILDGGDLVDNYNVKEEILIDYIDLTMQYELDVYYVLGNHDVSGANTNYINQTNLGFLTRYKWFHLVSEKIYEFENCLLYGINYEPVRLKKEFMFPEVHSNKKTILMTHANIYSQESLKKNTNIGVGTEDVITNADLLLCAHNHIGFKTAVKNGKSILINPGSIARTSIEQFYHGYGPRCVDIRIDKEIEFKYVKVPSEDVFKVKEHRDRRNNINHKINFIDRLKNLNYVSTDCMIQFKELLNNPDENLKRMLDKETIEICRSYLCEGNNE